MAETNNWFTLQQVDGDTHILSEYGHWEHTHCYLLEGRDRALLIDTGLGIGKIRAEVEALTPKPVTAVATHIHWDHIGGHKEFPEFYAHGAELSWLTGKFPLPVQAVRQMVARDCALPAGFDAERYELFQGTPARLLEDGDVIDLGGRQVQVLHTPGHAPGHLCFWEEARGYLFTGDLVYRGTLFASYPSTDPEAYLASLEKRGAARQTAVPRPPQSGHPAGAGPADAGCLPAAERGGKAVPRQRAPFLWRLGGIPVKIEKVTEQTLPLAGQVHAESWQESHRAFCSPEFVAKHTPEAQTDYLRREMAQGKELFLLWEDGPVGIVTLWGDLIENLYVLPRHQNRGYGTRLLKFAMARCQGTPTLWILSSNQGARRLYERHGFRETGRTKYLSDTLLEQELQWDRLAAIRREEKASHEEAYAAHALYAPGSWLAKPVKTVLELLPLLAGREEFRALDLGCGVGRNSIPVAKAFPQGRVDCVDILPDAIGYLEANARDHGVSGAIRGILSPIDDYPIPPDTYDLILAISALEHMDSRETMLQKLEEMRRGLRPGGIVCLVMNSGVREQEQETGAELPPQFEINLPTAQLQTTLTQIFAGWKVLKSTVTHQQYTIPRPPAEALINTDVLTFAAQKL